MDKNKEKLIYLESYYYELDRHGKENKYTIARYASEVDGKINYVSKMYKELSTDESNEIKDISSINEYNIRDFLLKEKNKIDEVKYPEKVDNLVKFMFDVEGLYDGKDYILDSGKEIKVYNRLEADKCLNIKYKLSRIYLKIIENNDPNVSAKKYLCDKVSHKISHLPEEWYDIEDNHVILRIDKNLKFIFRDLRVDRDYIEQLNIHKYMSKNENDLTRWLYGFKTSGFKYETVEPNENTSIDLYKYVFDEKDQIVMFFDSTYPILETQKIISFMRRELDLDIKVLRRNSKGFTIMIATMK